MPGFCRTGPGSANRTRHRAPTPVWCGHSRRYRLYERSAWSTAFDRAPRVGRALGCVALLPWPGTGRTLGTPARLHARGMPLSPSRARAVPLGQHEIAARVPREGPTGRRTDPARVGAVRRMDLGHVQRPGRSPLGRHPDHLTGTSRRADRPPSPARRVPGYGETSRLWTVGSPRTIVDPCAPVDSPSS